MKGTVQLTPSFIAEAARRLRGLETIAGILSPGGMMTSMVTAAHVR